MKTILKVEFNAEDGRYYIAAGDGSSTSECAFACAIVARIFAKQGFISDTKEFEDLIHKYLTDPQYDEVPETDAESDDESESDDEFEIDESEIDESESDDEAVNNESEVNCDAE